MPLCPIYKEALEKEPWKNGTGNFGLVFDKFAQGWEQGNGVWKFDSNEPGRWLKEFVARAVGERAQLEETAIRMRRLIERSGGTVLVLQNSSRFMMGMGNAHPLENGLTWHSTLGVPYLPGSSLKGILRSWWQQEYGDEEEIDLSSAFGSPGEVGGLIFFDLLPVEPVKLVREVMTPHYGEYYQQQVVPGDWHSPTPIQFAAVERGSKWQLGVSFQKRGKRKISPEFWSKLETFIEKVFEWNGAGAKTAVGYGRFELAEDTVANLVRKQEERELIQQEEEAKQQAREWEYALMSPDLAAIRQMADQQNWLDSDGAPNPETFPEALKSYLANRETLTSDVVDWLRKVFEQRHPNLWKNPDESKGKKNKPIHKPTWIEVVKLVKGMPITDE